MNLVKIYCLIDPRTNYMFYIGATRNTEKRLIAHLAESKDTKLLKTREPQYLRRLLIRDIVKAGKKPIIEVLESVPYKHHKKYEMHYYWYYR